MKGKKSEWLAKVSVEDFRKIIISITNDNSDFRQQVNQLKAAKSQVEKEKMQIKEEYLNFKKKVSNIAIYVASCIAICVITISKVFCVRILCYTQSSLHLLCMSMQFDMHVSR